MKALGKPKFTNLVTLQAWHMKSKSVQQSQILSLNSKAMTSEKSHTTHQVGMCWRAIIILFRTPQFSLFCIEIYEI